MTAKVIYHGTPMTPRAALLDVLTGRAGCVSFFRPDDVEAVEAVCPRVMFRQRGIQLLDGSPATRRGMGRQAARLDAVLSLARATAARRGPMGGHSRHAGSAEPAQRCSAERLALRHKAGRPALAYGRPAGSSGASLRAIRHGCAGMDWRPEAGAGRLRQIPAAHGRGRQDVRQPLAQHAHDARHQGGLRLSLHQRRRHEPCAERTPL
jgi:hypothetical protein